MGCLQTMQTGAIKASLRAGGLDGDHAFGDCGSRQPPESNAKEPVPRARQPDLPKRAEVTTGCYMARPARAQSIVVRQWARGRSNGSFRLRVANGKHGFESRTGFD